jgi:hypothetical protein
VRSHIVRRRVDQHALRSPPARLGVDAVDVKGRRLTVVSGLVVAAAAGVLGSAAGSPTSTVGFTVRGNPAAEVRVKPLATVSFLARASMRTGDRLMIVASRGSELRQRRVAACTLSPCPGTWREKTGISVRFQAFLERRSGGPFRVVARSRMLRVTWKAPPPPAPPPSRAAATPGHYEGRTSQNEIIRFDIGPDGLTVANLQTGQVNQSCNPHNSLSGGNIGPVVSAPVAPDGSFTVTGSGATAVSGSSITGNPPGTYQYTLTGHVSASVGAGTLKEDSSFTYRGVTYICSSGDVTWTATKS